MPRRTYSAGKGYRYGFNGKEDDSETRTQDYGMRIYEPRLGRFLSVDPLAYAYPWYTPYQFAGNKPIWAIDLYGLEEVISSAPVRFRVNVPGTRSAPYGYFPKGYNCDIYSSRLSQPTSASVVKSIVGYRADADKNADWSGATAEGTTQSGCAIERKYGVTIDPNMVNLVTIPGNDIGQNHFKALKGEGVSSGDLAVTMKITKEGNMLVAPSLVGDYGPQSQPGEVSASTMSALGIKSESDNNCFIYMVFPGTAKYLESSIGTDKDGNLLRSPTNADINNAYNTFRKEFFADENGNGTDTQRANTSIYQLLLKKLKEGNTSTNYDNATDVEKRKALTEPKNDDRNKN
jgi:RHS repeat-associated protein